ncbi:MAG: hypothetical protein M1831_000338 [Alyxoria varia]|nr:MAG: hypothetical protein M1831_000338 [Alyxoria varia]
MSQDHSEARPSNELPLDPDSYTLQRLEHATPEHLHFTTRRCFIGPIPEGWLNSHRRDWFNHHLHIHYSSRAATFSASTPVGRFRRLTGLDGASVSAQYAPPGGFPQPEDVDDDQNGESNEEYADAEITTEEPPAVNVPRTTEDTKRSSSAGASPGPRAINDAGSSSPHELSSGLSREYNSPSSSPNAPQKDSKTPKPPGQPKTLRKSSETSFATAHENREETVPNRLSIVHEGSREGLQGISQQGSSTNETIAPSQLASSSASLVKHDNATKQSSADVAGSKVQASGEHTSGAATAETLAKQATETGLQHRTEPGLVRFNVPNDDIQRQRRVNSRLAKLKKRGSFKHARRSTTPVGQIIKLEKMLVRVEFTAHELPKDFTENDSEKIESRVIEKWKEFMIVCRESAEDDSPFKLEMYKTRVIPATDKTRIKKRCTHEIPLNAKTCKVNLYSSLDKTMVIWVPHTKGYVFYILQSQSSANSMEWYTFLRLVLGWNRAKTLQVNVPDLSVNLRLENPFAQLESVREVALSADNDDEAVVRTMKEEQVAASNLIKRCMNQLEKSEFKDVIHVWSGSHRMGLAWKRYDRLEWVHGTNEKKMYGTIAMEKSHELELRPKKHYPTKTDLKKGEEMVEPPPVEGFLIRLTSQKGANQKFGKLFFKRLYFSTHNQYLVFNRPAQADPPPPPKLPMRRNSAVPSSSEIAENLPLIYSVNPFPVRDGQIEWFAESSEERIDHDQDAFDENQRRTGLLLNCDGAVNLSNVVEVREVNRGAVSADRRVGEGEDVDFNQEVRDTRADDGTTKDMDDEKTFEVVLNNDLVIRLQAFDSTTKQEWMSRLRELVTYWTHRTIADIRLYKQVRNQNLAQLAIDEESEAHVGQFAQKWEVTNSYASPELYNMCGIGCCRSVHLSGTLFRRPRYHGAFDRNLVILLHGKLLLFRDTMRRYDGSVRRQIHHERIGSLDLRDCYVYSGLIVANDLLYTSGASEVDRAHPGRHALPRIYPEDGWSSTDEDTMTCFVVWHGRRSSWFRGLGAEEPGDSRRRYKKVKSLGKEGRSVVFKARSRAERDRWVLAVGMEIERLVQGSSGANAESGNAGNQGDVTVVGDEREENAGRKSGSSTASASGAQRSDDADGASSMDNAPATGQ